MEQLIREAAFTHLNRLCAYKMMAQRGLIEDAVSKVPKSRGFLFYLADHPEDETLYNSAQAELAYRHFLEWQNENLSTEIGVLFSKEDVASGLFPPHRTLESVLEKLNQEELKNIWAEDETIGRSSSISRRRSCETRHAKTVLPRATPMRWLSEISSSRRAMLSNS